MSVAGNKFLLERNQWIHSLGLPKEDEYAEHLRELFNPTTPCPVRLESYLLLYKHLPEDLQPHPPLRLQDRHISPKLALQRVIHVPSLLIDLQHKFYAHLGNFIRSDNPCLSTGKYPTVDRGPEVASDAEDLILPYMQRIGYAAIQYAGKIHISPRANGWPLNLYHSPCSTKEHFLYEYAIRVKSVKPCNLNVYQRLDDLNRHRGALCIFAFYPPCKAGEDAVDACLVDQFTPTFATADRYVMSGSKMDERRPADWDKGFWSAYVSEPCFGTAPTIRSGSASQRTRMWVPARSGQRSSEYKPHAPHFVQRAWNTAVENDATFIVFSSGNTERIGIRHRATNTLFLSDVIKIKDESYYLIQMALFSAMAEDGVSLTEFSMSKGRTARDEAHSSPRPEAAREELVSESPQRPSKQHKVMHTRFLPAEFDEEMARRPVVLLTFDLDVHRSHMALAFLRKKPACNPGVSNPEPFEEPNGGKMYPIHDCVNIEIEEAVGSGPDCQVYRGTAKMVSKSDPSTLIEGPVILKVPHTSYLTRGLLNEYNAYAKLASAGVKGGIVKVHGLFEDPETGHLILIMQDIGRLTLQERDRQRQLEIEPPEASKTGLYKISEAEFTSLRGIVQSINEAGVQHYDLKPDNIMLSEDGSLYIIDFGLSQFTTPFLDDLSSRDPPWSEVDLRALALVEADSSGIRSFDRQTIEDMFIGRYRFDRRYSYRDCDISRCI